MQLPLWQVPPLQTVPIAFSWILPALHCFFPFFLLHLPFLHVSHSPGVLLHSPIGRLGLVCVDQPEAEQGEQGKERFNSGERRGLGRGCRSGWCP